MANRQQDRDTIPAQQGNERSERGAGFEERNRGEDEVRGVGESDEEFEDTEDLDEEEEETDEGSF